MHHSRWRAGLVALVTLFVPVIPAAAQDKVDVDVKVVKYDELTTTIKKLKGKVIVIDFWADW